MNHEIYTWKPAYSVHIDALDAQHKRLFSLLRELSAALECGEAGNAADRLFPQLIAYTQYHFSEEERWMEKHHYPKLAEHKLQHEILTRRVLLFQKSHQEGKGPVPVSLLLFLQEWLKNHIVGSDTQYGEFLRSQGTH